MKWQIAAYRSSVSEWIASPIKESLLASRGMTAPTLPGSGMYAGSIIAREFRNWSIATAVKRPRAALATRITGRADEREVGPFGRREIDHVTCSNRSEKWAKRRGLSAMISIGLLTSFRRFRSSKGSCRLRQRFERDVRYDDDRWSRCYTDDTTDLVRISRCNACDVWNGESGRGEAESGSRNSTRWPRFGPACERTDRRTGGRTKAGK